MRDARPSPDRSSLSPLSLSLREQDTLCHLARPAISTNDPSAALQRPIDISHIGQRRQRFTAARRHAVGRLSPTTITCEDTCAHQRTAQRTVPTRKLQQRPTKGQRGVGAGTRAAQGDSSRAHARGDEPTSSGTRRARRACAQPNCGRTSMTLTVNSSWPGPSTCSSFSLRGSR